MRKVVISILAAGLVVGALGGPAAAGKKKTISKEFSAGPHAPLPNATEDIGHSCIAGQEGVHKTTISFKTPGKGTLTVGIHDFDGDWDLYVLDSKGAMLGVSEASQLQGAAPEENVTVRLAAKKTYDIVACNFAGGPTASGHYKYVYKKR